HCRPMGASRAARSSSALSPLRPAHLGFARSGTSPAGRRAAGYGTRPLDPARRSPQPAGPRRMIATPRTAMLLAAGLATRMRPLTDRTAKPLLPLGGRALIDHALDRLAAAGVEMVVVNAHWHADLLEAHLRTRTEAPRTVLRREASLLETGGGVKAALDLL